MDGSMDRLFILWMDKMDDDSHALHRGVGVGGIPLRFVLDVLFGSSHHEKNQNTHTHHPVGN